MNVFLFVASWLIVAFGQSSWVPILGPLAALFGYALFWKAALLSKRPFLFSFVWFAGVQTVQISWMSETTFMGPLIWVVYLGLSAAIGLQFTCLTWLIGKAKPLTLSACLALAGVWVLLEWIRVFPCTGFLWNPAGLALSASTLSLQAASLFGVYGLSFWVIFVNLTALRAAYLRTKQAFVIWVAAALFPFAFGVIHQAAPKGFQETLSALLVQPYLLPDERDYFPESPQKWVPPLVQWDRILGLIEQGGGQKSDLIVLPESAAPFPAYMAAFPLHLVQQVWTERFGESAPLRDFPKLGGKGSKFVRGQWLVSNAFWMQAIANHYDAEIIAGMEDGEGGKRFNAALHFKPNQESPSRYEKRVLVPIAEYIPLWQWKALSNWISDQFGISGSFEPGVKPKLFRGRVPIGISICMEETNGGIIRESCRQGAKLLVNLTNDGWFPHTRLVHQHFDHGVIRAVENGVPALRACCTGVTGGVDCFGRVLAQSSTEEPDALFVRVPLANTPTLYSIWGDRGILILSCLCIVGFACCSGRFLLEIKRVD